MQEKQNSLELFSGSAKFSQLCEERNINAWSVDFNPKFNARICCDILDLQPGMLPCQFKIIWASPDCRYFSRNGDPSHWKKITDKYRQYTYIAQSQEAEKSILQLEKTIELIKFYNPDVWFIENPVGRIQHMKCLKSMGHYRYGVNYKDWGFNYSKETYLFTNQHLPFMQKKIICPGRSVAQINGYYNRSLIPEKLLKFLIDYTL